MWATGGRHASQAAGRLGLFGVVPMRWIARVAPKRTSSVTTPALAGNSYPPEKQLIWNQCQSYLGRNVFILIQLDNLDSKAKLEFKITVSKLGCSLKTPKGAILRKALRLSPFHSLEPSIVGTMGLIVSSREPHELSELVRFVKSHKRATLIGGKIGSHSFSTEGINEACTQWPSELSLKMQMVGLLQGPSRHLANALNSAPASLLASIDQHIKIRQQ